MVAKGLVLVIFIALLFVVWWLLTSELVRQGEDPEAVSLERCVDLPSNDGPLVLPVLMGIA